MSGWFSAKRTGTYAVWLAVALTSSMAPAIAQTDDRAAPSLKKELETSGGPYCGVYSVYAALRMFGNPVQFVDLIQPKYVGSFYGSTMAELQQAVRDFGAHAEPMEGLTASALRMSPHPVILHVRRPGLKTSYAHWILFLGVEDGKARIVDPPNSVQLLPFPELLALWDGTGLVVAPEPPRTWWIQMVGWLEQAILFLVGLVVLAAARFAIPRNSLWNRWYGGAAALLALSVGLALIANMLHDDGLIGNKTAVAQVVGRHFKPELPSVSVAEVEQMLDQPDVTIIDARFPDAYEAGHLKGAVNLPVYSGLVERSETLKGIDPNGRVVIYCQSESCGWGEVIASDLYLRGYRNVVLFPGGWNDWARHECSKRDK